jgi:hypothetical protein
VVLVLGRRFLARFGASTGGFAVLACAGACSSDKHPPPIAEPMVIGGAGGNVAPDACSPAVPVQTDPQALGLCGSLLLPALGDPSNFYFLIDRSGSMGDWVGGQQKYGAVANAAVTLVRDLGARINVGGAVFPGPDATIADSCPVGGEVFATRRGDWPSATRCGYGQVTRDFSTAISLPSKWVPYGGTPIAATLARISPTLMALADGRRTHLILATDGGPNCNFDVQCDRSGCIPNIEKSPGCDPSTNCCSIAGVAGPGNCLDDAATVAQIAALHEQGVSTYVIGIPGSLSYAALLDQMAAAGGTARATNPKYYDVPNLSELTQVLKSIGTEVILTCNFVLQDPPEQPDQVNVYLDQQQVLYDELNGWTWRNVPGAADAATDGAEADAADAQPSTLDHTRFDLHGTACDRLMSGQVTDVRVALGCPTALIK